MNYIIQLEDIHLIFDLKEKKNFIFLDKFFDNITLFIYNLYELIKDIFK